MLERDLMLASRFSPYGFSSGGRWAQAILGRGSPPPPPPPPQIQRPVFVRGSGADVAALNRAVELCLAWPGFGDSWRHEQAEFLRTGNIESLAQLQRLAVRDVIEAIKMVPMGADVPVGALPLDWLAYLWTQLHAAVVYTLAAYGRGADVDLEAARGAVSRGVELTNILLSQAENEGRLREFQREDIFGEWVRGASRFIRGGPDMLVREWVGPVWESMKKAAGDAVRAATPAVLGLGAAALAAVVLFLAAKR